MIVKFPSQLTDFIRYGLEGGPASPPEKTIRQSLVVLENFPTLITGPEVLQLVANQLHGAALGNRATAARILCKLGDARGVLHLTYNALSKHPVTGDDQTTISGWGDSWLLRYASRLTGECIGLLLEDVTIPPHWFHGDLLASAPSELVVPGLLKLLATGPDLAAVQAAYALTFHGRLEGRDLLQAAVEIGNVRALEMALVALSHIGDEQSGNVIRAVANGTHPILSRIPDYIEATGGQHAQREFRVRDYRNRAAERLAVVERQISIQDIVRRYYLSSQRGEWETRDWVRRANFPADYAPKFFAISHDKVTNTPDFLHEFSTESDRQALAAVQREVVEDLLDRVPEDCWYELSRWLFMRWSNRPADSKYMTHYYPDGVEIQCEREDYVFAATDWLLNPVDYRSGIISRTRWDRDS